MNCFRLLPLLAVAGLLLALPLSAAADIRTDFQDRYDAMKSAMDARNTMALGAMLTPDFISIDIKGQSQDAARMLKQVLTLAPDPDSHSRTTIVSVKVDGDAARVTQTYEMTTRKPTLDRSMQTVRLVADSSDIWRNTDGVWRMQSTQTERMDYFVDEKLVASLTRQPN